MSGHTPEPWQSHDDQSTEGFVTIIANVDGEYIEGSPSYTYDVVAVCQDEYGERLPNVAANVRLICAAPELLGALNLAIEYWGHRQQRYKNRSPVWVQKARAALAKAGVK